MPNTWEVFKFLMMDNASSLFYKEDANGLIKKGNPLLGEDYALKRSPTNWDEMQLKFARNTHYWAMNRSFSNSFKFIADGARILRTLLYTGKGIEAGVTLIILKWDQSTGVYRLYYSGQIDFSKAEDQSSDGITVDTLEGGVSQMLKNYENTIHEIPCDGSIPENIKVNADGKLYDDVFHYQILNIAAPYAGVQPLGCTFISNDGDNIGITHGDQFVEQPYDGYYQKSSNFLFSSQEPIKVRLQGFITVKSDPREANTQFYMYTATSLSQPRGVGGTDHAIGLVKPQVPADQIFQPVNSQVTINGQYVYGFDATIDLQANENLFIFFFNQFQPHPVTILGGSFSMSFSSRYRASRVWGITMYDLFKLLVKRNNQLASTTSLPFDFEAASNLLQNRLDIVVTSGDAARASTDPNYYQYFNQATINPANPGNQNYNPAPFLGSAIKACIADLFDTANPLLCAAMGNQKLPGQKESLFLESKAYVFDSSVITMSLKRVANIRISVASDYLYNWVKAGWRAQQYDEKSGKFETNTTFQWQAPVKTLAKVLDLVAKWRADSDGFEFTRYNTQGGKSTTYNDSDSSVFVLDTDPTIKTKDFYLASFVSDIPNPDSLTTTNQRLVLNQAYQPVFLTATDGEYFVNGIDFSIFMFNQPAPGSQTINVNFTALLNGLPGDSATIRMWVNGVAIRTWSQAITGVNTVFNINDNNFRFFSKGDNIYFTIDTVKTCAVTITAFMLNVGAGYFIAASAGNIDIPATSSSRLISLPLITPQHVVIGGLQIPVVSSGFQYFRFLSPVHNTNFDWSGLVAGYTQGPTAEHVTFDVWRNGVNVGTATFPGNSNTKTPYNHGDNSPAANILFSGNFDFQLYDIVWLTASAGNLTAWITAGNLRFTSTAIDAIGLLRPVFDSVRGIPNPQTAFNIPFSPRRMIEANKALLAVGVYNLAPGQLTFQTADKNQYMSTTAGGVTITENANIDVHDLGDPYFYPFFIDIDTEVDINFADLLSGQANGHIEVIWGTKKIYGYPMEVTSKPAFNESQTWKLLVSKRTNLADLVSLFWDGIIPLQLMDSLISEHCPVHFVPLDYQKDPQDNSTTMDEDWFKNRIADWSANEDFFNPWQQNDTISFQFQSYGLDPVMLQVLDGDGNNVGDPINVPDIVTSALPSNQKLYQLDLALAAFAEGTYYFLLTFGVGEGMASWISEPIEVKAKWPGTVRFKYKHSLNILGTVFANGYNPSFRTYGKIMRFKAKSKYALFNDQNQDADITGAQKYRSWKLQLGHKDSLVPDYVTDLAEAIMDLDTVFIDGNQYTRDGADGWQEQTFPGQPKVIATLDIRKARNTNGNILNTASQLTDDMSGGYTIDPAAFGQSQFGQEMIQVTND